MVDLDSTTLRAGGHVNRPDTDQKTEPVRPAREQGHPCVALRDALFNSVTQRTKLKYIYSI